MTGYIYCYKNKINQKRYIGQTTLSLAKRAGKAGSYYLYNSGPTKFSQAIKKYGWNNFEVSILAEIEHDSYEELKHQLNDLEVFYISKFDTYKNGYNSTLGGSHTKPVTAETKRKLSEKLTGHHFSEERNTKVQASLFELYNSRPVIQYSALYKVIKIWDSISAAITELQLPSKNAFLKACNGKQHNSHMYQGYYWWFLSAATEFPDYIPPEANSQKLVCCVERNLKFKTIKDAADFWANEFNVSQKYCYTKIKVCLDTGTRTSHGCHWIYSYR